jgi:cell division protein FtsN
MILGVLFLAGGAGMLGGRYALERYGDVSPGPPAVKPPSTSTPAAPAPKGEQEPELEPDTAARNEAGDTREMASPPEILAGEDSSAAPKETAPVVEEADGETEPKYVIQAMSTSSRPDARAARGAIMAAGFPAGVFEAELAGRGKWYRVYIGPYENEEEARPALEAVRRIPGFEGSFLKEME